MRAGGGNLIIQHLKYANTVAKEGIGPYWQLPGFLPAMPHARALLQWTWHVERKCLQAGTNERACPSSLYLALHDTWNRKLSSCGHKCMIKLLFPPLHLDPLEDFMDAPAWEGAPRRRYLAWKPFMNVCSHIIHSAIYGPMTVFRRYIQIWIGISTWFTVKFWIT